ncbi:hypothetical protein GPY51_21625 [Photorhabdus laumondii subsp. laumondii]|nr:MULTISPECIES: hypothetical protein [Photorhabdus]AXG44569.1 hypothetical protein PluDJC_21480 [Photorhabdus laumondii subsp. laumondii]KTL59933.1 hypothetical protein AA106_15120 [Photorhabdus laumondii subsp. laumondii]MCZ1247743.1 hypothetical protein [Photorhabdus laumondii subsp. laumondii]NDK96897.1 hypothetical protein [Photorhabdus laumondii subsp. laumondii]NDL18486.1 hypothetical protein [Photorhabdus laumondii subsp. laumondii]
MLYQESIDSFLRETDSETRFKKFSEVDDELVNINSARSTLLSLKSDVSKKKQELVDTKNKLSSEINRQKDNKDYVHSINIIIKDVNEYLDEIKIDEVIAPFTKNEHFHLSARLKEAENIIKNRVKENDEKLSKIEVNLSQLKLGASIYYKYKECINERSLILDKIKFYDEVGALKESFNTLEKELLLNQDVILSLRELNKNAHEYFTYKLKLDSTLKEIEELKLKLKMNDALIKSLNDSLNEKIIFHQKVCENIDQLGKEQANLYFVFNTIKDKSTSLDGVEKELANMEIEIKKNKGQKDVADICLSSLEKLTLFDFKWLPEFFIIHEDNKNELSDIYAKYCYVYKSKVEIDGKIKSINKELESINQQQTDISFLIDKASSIVISTKQSHCPLCERDNETYDELISRINNNSMLSDIEKKKNASKSSLMEELEQLSMKLDRFNVEFIEKKKSISNGLKDEISSLENLINESSQKKSTLVESKNIFISEINKFNSSVMFMSKYDYSKHLISKVQCERDREHSISKEIEDIKESIKSRVNQIELNKKIIDLENERFKLVVHLSKYSDFIKSNQLSEGVNKDDFISFVMLKTDKLNDSQKGLKDRIGKIVIKINKLESENKDSQFKGVSKEKMNALLVDLEDKMSLLSKENQWFISVADSFDNEDNSVVYTKVKDSLELQVTGINVKNRTLSDCLAKFSSIESISSKIVDYSDTSLLEKELYSISSKVSKLSEVIVELDSDIRKLGNEIKLRVDSFFNTELINKIYSSIDPHPEYKKIVFTCTSDDNPRLLISAQSEKNDKLMSPTLSFSSAQINVLALSIFLARALSSKDDEGNPVDCILIDDPVQSIDAINTLGLIDTLRMLSIMFNKQIIVTTHDENFHELLKKKMPSDLFSSKFLRLSSFGKVSSDA